jgi:uncharacterized OB-fold protein
VTTIEGLGLELNVSAAQFLDGLAEGMLLIPYCAVCGNHRPPWVLECPVDYRHATAWRDAGDEITLWSWTTYWHRYPISRPLAVPYIVAQVLLVGGVRLNGQLIDADSTSLQQGTPLAFAPIQDRGRVYPAFSLSMSRSNREEGVRENSSRPGPTRLL